MLNSHYRACKGDMIARKGEGRGQALHFGMVAKMQGMTPTVDPASPAHPLETRTSTRPRFAHYEFGRCRIRSVSEISKLENWADKRVGAIKTTPPPRGRSDAFCCLLPRW